MRKVIISIGIFCLSCMFPNQVKAQVVPNFGIRLGINSADIFPGTNSDRRIGFMGGIYSNYKIPHSRFIVQGELLYSQKGNKPHSFEQDLEPQPQVTLDYIEIPLLVKYKLASVGLAEPYLYVGPSMGINIKSEVSASDQDRILIPEYDKYTKKTEFGLVFGTEVDINRFNVGFRYGIGTEIANRGSERNSVVSFVAGIQI